VDLRWLITGMEPIGPTAPAQHPVVKRAADLLAKKPDAAPALAAFIEILSKTMEFPQAGVTARTETPSEALADATIQQSRRQAAWIPVLGRTAAGVPVFWSDADKDEGITKLAELIGQHVDKLKGATTTKRGRTAGTETSPPSTVQIVTLTDAPDRDPVEFVAAESIKINWPDAFAVRVDGESMAPDISNGDLVVLSPSAPAEDGKPAVVQLQNQVGVTCKIYRRSGEKIHLIPINEHFAPQEFPIAAVQWAFRVLARVRPERSS